MSGDVDQSWTARSTPSPPRVAPSFAALRLWTARGDVQKAKLSVIFTVVVLLGVFMITCFLGLVVIPRFDRPLAASPVGPVPSPASRSAR